MHWFADQVAWVTGASSGIGYALAIELARRGADVAVSARRRDRLEELASQIEAIGRRALVLPCDVADEESLRPAPDAVVARLGRLDLAVANAGFHVSGPIEQLSAADWRRQFDVNVVGAALTARFSLPALRETRGRIGLIGSVSALWPAAKNGAYCASKAALSMIGQTLSIECHGSGVTCTTVHPGYVESEIAQVDNQGVFHPDRQDRRPRQLIWPTDRAAQVIARALHQRRREFVFTGHGKVGGFVARHFPGLVHLASTRSLRA
jgi:NAD(P)-dependent dehydrogenase (short-subunit alcohol dehydrogenase family)